MFMEQERLPIVQEMILAPTIEERQATLDQLLPFQRSDFEGLFRAMVNPATGDGYPVVIRLIDPPLHEFLPSYEDLLVEVTRLEDSGKDPKELEKKRKMLNAVAGMREMNPMLGLRGCRLGLIFPEINVMQTRAILEAAANVAKEGVKLQPKIMIPLVGHVNELAEVRRQLEAVAQEMNERLGGKVDYKFGTMIELPRAALTAGQIADGGRLLQLRHQRPDPDDVWHEPRRRRGQVPAAICRWPARTGTRPASEDSRSQPLPDARPRRRGAAGRIGFEEGRAANPALEVGICGEHGGDPDSIAFCNEVGLNYVSCSPFRVPKARLAAAQAVLAGAERDEK